MTKVVYTSSTRSPLRSLISPVSIAADLFRHRDLIVSSARRDFEATYRNTFLGAAWMFVTPLLMLAIFTLVFGYIFKGRFNTAAAQETPAEFALALFVGLSFYNCIGQTLTMAPGLVLGASTYVKTLSFPLQILTPSAALVLITRLCIELAISIIAFVLMYGYLHWTAIFLVGHIACIGLIALGLSWFLSSLCVFVRDVGAVMSPINIVLMFMSSVFFPIETVPRAIAFLFKFNPIAVIIDQARGELLYGRVPDLLSFVWVFLFSILVAIGGHWFFSGTKAGFADVI